MKYAFIQAHRFIYRVEKMCKVLIVSRSGYYRWLKTPESKRAKENRRLIEMIKEIHSDTKTANYGSPRMTIEIQNRGLSCSEARIARLMRQEGIVATRYKRFKVTTQSDHRHTAAANLLQQNFTVEHPQSVWVSDITYIRTGEHWMYLTVVIDLYDRQVAGWSMSHSLNTTGTTVAALKQAYKRQQPTESLIFHSDRGVQYACEEFRELLGHYKYTQSMSGKGNCYDNAVAESFFKTLKSECIYQHKFASHREAKTAIFDYIETFYNKKRLHSSLGNISPEQFLNNYHQKRYAEYVA